MKSLEFNKLIYLASRLTGLVSKPAIILFMMQYSTADKAYEISQNFFIIGSLFVLLNNEAHKNFYKAKFDKNSLSNLDGSIFRTYIEQSILHWLIFSIFVFFISCIFFHLSILNSICITILIVNEKIFDEMMRYALYSSNYIVWSIIFLCKILALILAVSFYYLNENLSFNLLCVIFYAIALYCIGLRYNINNFTKLLSIELEKFRCVVHIYKKNYISNYLSAQIGAFVSVNIGTLDKWIMQIQSVDKATFVGLTLLSQIGNIFIVLVDNLFMAFNRRKFVESNKFNDVAPVSKIIIISLAFLVASYFILLKWNIFDINLNVSFDVVLIVLLIYVFIGYSRLIIEYLFWRIPRYKLTITDALTLALTFLFGYYMYARAGVIGMYAVLLAMSIARVLIYFSFVRKN